MPLDINLFREDRGGDPEKIRESQRRRFKPVEAVDEIIAQDNAWRKLTGDIDFLKKDRNAVQKQVGQKMKAKEPCEELVATIKRLDGEIAQAEADVVVMKKAIDSMVNKIGNLVDPTVPVSKDEDADNLVVRTWGTPRNPEGLLNHHDLLWRVGGYEPERGVAVAGHRGYFLKDVGVMLNQAFVNYGTAFLREKGYTLLQPPFMMKKDVMAGVAQLEQFDEELYKVGGDDDDKYLIATSEQPICGFHMGEWIPEKDLPIRICGTSTCFRKEAGAHGKDTWGIFRVHQFEKIEQFVICEGDLEKSQEMQERMASISEEFYKSLGFPYRLISIVSGALNNAAIKKLDLECWFPGYNDYRELVSCSNCTDYQSRAMEIRCGVKKLGEKEKKYVHMLNSTLCATGRAICCLLETYQEADGVRIPDVLVPYMGGMTFLPFVRDSRDIKGGAKTPAATAAPAKAKAPAAAPKPAAADTPPAAPTADVAAPVLSAEGEALKASIEACGEEIRAKKAAKAGKDEIKALVDQLLALKTRFTENTGLVFGPPMVPVGAAKSEAPKKEAPKKTDAPKKEAAAAPAVCQPPAVPIEPPASVLASVPRRTRISLPTPTSVWKQEVVDVARLEEQLRTHSYVTGAQPTAEDLRVVSVLASGETDIEKLLSYCNSAPVSGSPQVARWLRSVGSYSVEEVAAWN